MTVSSINEIVSEILAIEAEEARNAGTIGYMARAMVQATMPHSAIDENEFSRTNGNFTLTMMAPSHVGLPYGNIPRLLMAWISTEAVRTKTPTIVFGNTLSDFMTELNMIPTGGRWGSITRLKNQMIRLFSSYVSISREERQTAGARNVLIADSYDLWWTPKAPEQAALWQSTVTLGQTFYDEIVKNPIPIDMRALKTLKRSPMALDIYCWLTYRMFYLKASTEIPWELLQAQFGAGYPTNPRGLRNFKQNFLLQLKKVLGVYADAKVEKGDRGLILKPSKTHIPPVPRKKLTHKR